MIDLGDGHRAQCETLHDQLALLRARHERTVGELAALHRETSRLRHERDTARQDVHRRLLAAFTVEGAHPDFVSRIMLRLVAVPLAEVDLDRLDARDAIPAQRSESTTPSCVCAACGPPWRDTTPRPDHATSPAMWLTWASWLALCPACGDKRCPGASDHRTGCAVPAQRDGTDVREEWLA